MMREIEIPLSVIKAAMSPDVTGIYAIATVKVDWPELQLTEEQQIANRLAFMAGEQEPYPDHSVFKIRIPRIPPRV